MISLFVYFFHIAAFLFDSHHMKSHLFSAVVSSRFIFNRKDAFCDNHKKFLVCFAIGMGCNEVVPFIFSLRLINHSFPIFLKIPSYTAHKRQFDKLYSNYSFSALICYLFIDIFIEDFSCNHQ